MAGRKCAPFLALFAALVGASVGCSLLVDTSGFSGEAPTSPSEAGTTDAADAADATAVDASTDASTPMDAEAGFVCDATFCDGFDDGPRQKLQREIGYCDEGDAQRERNRDRVREREPEAQRAHYGRRV